MFQGVMILVALAAPVWFGPATATFPVQLPGDPYDSKRNDVRVRFVGDRDQREERPAWFDPGQGAWRATLFSQREGLYRAVLVRNGKELQIEANEGILELSPAPSLGFLEASEARPNRLVLDTGATWIGFGADLGADASSSRVNDLADAGASWMRVAPPDDPFRYDALIRFGAAMDAAERRGLDYTLVVPSSSTEAWRRYALNRFGTSPHLIGWEGAFADPQGRPAAPVATPWEGLFENKPGPFLVAEKDAPRLRSLKALVERSGWAGWNTTRVWKGIAAKGAFERGRMILLVSPGAKLAGLPLADGTYDLVTIDPTTATVTSEQARVVRSALSLSIPAERFLVLSPRA